MEPMGVAYMRQNEETAVGYIRVGTADAQESIRMQTLALESYAASKGYKMATVYFEFGTGNRPEDQVTLQALINELSTTCASVVLTWKPECISRRVVGVYEFTNLMEERGVRVEYTVPAVLNEMERQWVERLMVEVERFLDETDGVH